jgi:ribosomal protein L13E
MLLTRAREVAQQDHISLDELAAEALQRHLARRILERFKREVDMRRRDMTDEEVENTVAQAVQEYR